MNNKKLPILAFLMIAVFILSSLSACQFLINPGDPNILFQDSFSSKLKLWDNYSDINGAAEYRDGLYRIMVNQPHSVILAAPRGLNFKDVQILVQAKRTAGNPDNFFGILCRYQDRENFYQFSVSSDGYYDISKIRLGQRYPLTGDQLIPSDLIPQENKGMILGASCIGDQIGLYVNGVELARVTDGDLDNGNVGLFAGTLDNPGTEITFDELVVLKP
jgi:hypothetical protein